MSAGGSKAGGAASGAGPAGQAGPPGGGAPGPSGPRTVRLCLLGFGSVARALCELLVQQDEVLAASHGLRFVITAVGTRRGSLLAPEGLTPAEVLRRCAPSPAAGADGLSAAGLAAAGIPADVLPAAVLPGAMAARLPDLPRPAAALIAASTADILVELTVMEEGAAPLATSHIETAFSFGMDVVTANKGPLAWDWRRVKTAADAAGRRVRFESTVMDGLPVFGLLEHSLPDCRLLGFEGVFNATTNSIIDAIGAGRSFEDALAHAQAQGYAEADPAHDIDGWDAACKAAALANVAMDAGITPADIDKESLSDVPRERIAAARAAGKRLRLVTTVWRAASGSVHGHVRATELDVDHPLAPVGGESLGAILHTDLMADVFVCEIDALVPQTAYGVYADLLQLCPSR